MEKSKEIWSILKSIKTKYFLLSNVADVCQARDTFQSNDQINENIDLLQDQLRINRTPEDLSLNDSKGALNSIGEMFIYLNYCSKDMDPWVLLSKDLFLKQSPDLIILTLNRIIKMFEKQKKDISFATKIMEKITSVLSLNYQHIDDVLKMRNQDNIVTHDLKLLQTSSNNPVHILDRNINRMSTSAFIPLFSSIRAKEICMAKSCIRSAPSHIIESAVVVKLGWRCRKLNGCQHDWAPRESNPWLITHEIPHNLLNLKSRDAYPRSSHDQLLIP